MKVRHRVMHAYQIGPTDSIPLAQDCLAGPVSEQGWMLWGRQSFCPHFSTPYSLVWLHSPIWIHSCGIIGCHLESMSSFSIAGSLEANTEGMVKSGIGCWVVAAIGRLCRFCTNSIVWHIVKLIKLATWFHPLVLLTMIGTKLTRCAFPLCGLMWHVVLCTPCTHQRWSQLGVYLPAHILPVWRQWNKHWHTLMQPSIGPKLSLFFGTPWHWWRQPRFGLHIGGPTWQHSPKAYAYPRPPPRFDMGSLMLTTIPTILSALVAVCLASSLKVILT